MNFSEVIFIGPNLYGMTCLLTVGLYMSAILILIHMPAFIYSSKVYDGCLIITDLEAVPADAAAISVHKFYSLHTTSLPFSCHNAPCSAQNEAFWLGGYPFDNTPSGNDSHLLINRKWHQGEFLDMTVRRDWIYFINQVWKSFVSMTDDEGKQLEDTNLERLPPPDYAIKAGVLQETDRIVPMICDPRSNLYCEGSSQLFKETYGGNSLESGYGRCKCHPLYSDDSELTERKILDTSSGSKVIKEIKAVTICLGRANTPCQFGRRVPFEAVDQETTDRDGPFMRPDHIDDFERMMANAVKDPNSQPKTKQDWLNGVVEFESRCVPNAECQFIGNDSTLDEYRNRTIWHGFGYNPILVDMMLLSVTKICLCKEGFVANVVHECVPKD